MNDPGRRPPTNCCPVADEPDIPPATADLALDLARRLVDVLATGRVPVVEADLPRPTLAAEWRVRWVLPSGASHTFPADSEADAEAKAEQLRVGGSGQSTATVESRLVTAWRPSFPAGRGVQAEPVRG
jgi:hypothetical protein